MSAADLTLTSGHNALTSSHNALTSGQNALTSGQNALTSGQNALTSGQNALKYFPTSANELKKRWNLLVVIYTKGIW